MRVFLLVFLLFFSGACACQEKEDANGPAAVATRLIEGMRSLHGDPATAREVYELLWTPARKNLQERAKRASALSGREVHPGEMLVPSWFALHLVPVRIEERIDGDWAQITFIDAQGTSVSSRCNLEEDGWKIALELPPPAPIRKREDSE